ncbi:MAG: transposase [Chloroflexota bacterium]
MRRFETQHHRRSIRLKGYDYSQAGVYFVTIVTWGRLMLFGKIENGEMKLNRYGEIVQKWWNDIPNHFPNVETGAFVIMPNHVHGVIIITEDGRGTVPVPHDTTITQHRGDMAAPPQNDDLDETSQGGETPPLHGTNTDGRGTVPVPCDTTISQHQGEMAAPPQNDDLDETNQGGETPPLRKPTLGQIVAYFKYKSTKEINVMDGGRIAKLWQRNYYEHIVRNEHEMENIWNYIESNPAMWATDDENPNK